MTTSIFYLLLLAEIIISNILKCGTSYFKRKLKSPLVVNKLPNTIKT